MFSKLTRVEGIIIKLIVIQFICMVVAQWILQDKEYSVHFNKSIYYEGVVNEGNSKAVETLDR